MRIAAIIAADFRIRFRRLSTLVIFLLLSAIAYGWVPAPSTGRTLLQINGQRALYNSAAVGMATAALAGLFIGLFGFYVISNTISRDARSRCGFVIASTNVSGIEYLIGKFAGNIVFLTTFTFGFMCSAMTMILVRGEAPLEPLIFAKQYLLIVPSVIVTVSAFALLFESIPFLSGRFGDVAFFFLWTILLAVTVTSTEKGHGPGVLGAFDISGLSFMIDSLRRQLHTSSISVGASSFDASKGTFVFHGLVLDRVWIVPRLLSMLMPVPILLLARVFFHRFDPVRVKQSAAKHRDSLFARINRLFKPLTRASMLLVTGGRGPSLVRSAMADAILTTSATPLLAIAAVALAIVSIVTPFTTSGPIVVAAMGIAIAGIASRETQAGTSALTYAAPYLQPRFVAFKTLSTLFVLAPFAIVPLIRSIGTLSTVLPFAVGILFIASAATFLGMVSGNAKTFTVLFLMFWYVAVNDKGATPAFDFAGFTGRATPMVTAVYALIAIAFIGAAQATHVWRLQRT